MKAHIVKKMVSEEKSNEELFYISCYNKLLEIENLYSGGFSLEKVKSNIQKKITGINMVEEIYNSKSIENIILASLIGLKKELLENANSDVIDRKLFKYKDYKSESIVYFNDNLSIPFEKYAKSCVARCGFNPSSNGPFPEMLEIIKDNNKNRPYDYISKIRNAFLHGEFYLDKTDPEIVHIYNTDDNNNIIFEGKLLLEIFQAFVLDFFGIAKSVGSKYVYYQMLENCELKNENDLVNYLREFTCIEYKFTKIPDKYQFYGQKGSVFEQLNSCIDCQTTLINTNFDTILDKLEKEGVEYIKFERKLDNKQIIEYLKFVKQKYLSKTKNLNDVIEYISTDIKLLFSPVEEIINSLTNIYDYSNYKRCFLSNGFLGPQQFLDELEYDKHCINNFKFAFAFLKLSIINYAIESSYINDIDFNCLNIDGLKIINEEVFNKRLSNIILEKKCSNKEAYNRLVLEIMRNALAHGGDRISVSLGETSKIKFIDKYHNLPEVGIEININTINKIFNEFNPNIISNKAKVKRK